MKPRRLLNTRYYRHRRKARAKLYSRIYGRFAGLRRTWAEYKAKRKARMAVFDALIQSILGKRLAGRYVPRRKVDYARSDMARLMGASNAR